MGTKFQFLSKFYLLSNWLEKLKKVKKVDLKTFFLDSKIPKEFLVEHLSVMTRTEEVIEVWGEWGATGVKDLREQ